MHGLRVAVNCYRSGDSSRVYGMFKVRYLHSQHDCHSCTPYFHDSTCTVHIYSFWAVQHRSPVDYAQHCAVQEYFTSQVSHLHLHFQTFCAFYEHVLKRAVLKFVRKKLASYLLLKPLFVFKSQWRRMQQTGLSGRTAKTPSRDRNYKHGR